MEWISVKKKIPSYNTEVLGYTKRKYSSISIFILHESYGWCNYEDQFINVTYWMPLPEPPKD